MPVSDPWPTDLAESIREAVELVREVSMQTDPQEMVRRYRDRVSKRRPSDLTLSLSRRDLNAPYFKITRSSEWEEEIDPWKDNHKLPLLKGGLVADLVYGNEPALINDLELDRGDPAAPYLQEVRSLFALPLYDRGESINMVLVAMRRPNGFDVHSLPELIVTGNLFGRATHNLVLAEQVRLAYEALDAEFKTIAAIQQSLLPPTMPDANGLDVSAFYDTAHRAGGDYFDFFPLDRGRTGILIADVSGHGAAAAVVMARMHAAMHAGTFDLARPQEVLSFANEHLLMSCRENSSVLTFVTAFYAVYDPAGNRMTYSSAGHNPPRWRKPNGSICSIAGARSLPLGIDCGTKFEQECFGLERHDDLLLYTDGIVEAANPRHEQFGLDRLDHALNQPHSVAADVTRNVLNAVDEFREAVPPADDRTLLALRIS